MLSPFIAKLQNGCALTDEDQLRLEAISSETRRVGPRQDIISEGDRPDDVHLVLEGIACRYKILPGGKRHIMALLLPGDFCDLHVAILGAMDHAIGTITACTLVEIPKSTINDLTANHPRIAKALWWATLVDEAILREWLVSMGGRPAEQQLAHLICELLVRLQVTGLADANSYHLPLTQEDLADTLGLSIVHLNRSLQKLRREGRIRLEAQRLTVCDWPSLKQLAGFNPNYLHLRRLPYAV
jgi:CRP-like cAMP-binding protein